MTSTHLPATLLLLGSGELGKEVAITAQRLGCRVVAVDRYANAPAMQVADTAVVIPMTDAAALKQVIREHQPALVIPEIEALAVDALAELEAEVSSGGDNKMKLLGDVKSGITNSRNHFIQRMQFVGGFK